MSDEEAFKEEFKRRLRERALEFGGDEGADIGRYVRAHVEAMIEVSAEAIAAMKAKTECQFVAHTDPTWPSGSVHAPSVPYCTTHQSYLCSQVAPIRQTSK